MSLATYHNLNPKKLNEIQGIVEEHRDEIVQKWRKHFGKALRILHLLASGFSKKEREYFLSYKDYPYFRDQTLKSIQAVQLLHSYHLYWPELDVDSEIDNIENPEKSPLKWKATKSHLTSQSSGSAKKRASR